MSFPQTLAAAPSQLISAGRVHQGAFAGLPGDASLTGLSAPYATGLGARLVEKKWTYALVSSPEVFVAMVVIEFGYLSSAFLAVFDRGGKKLLFDENTTLPPGFASVGDDPGARLHAQLSGFQKARIRRDGPRVRVEASWGKATVDLILDASKAPPPMGVCTALAADRFNYTQKWVGLSATGEVKLGRTVFPIDRAPAGMDFTHGHLARETNWRWAFATGQSGGREIGFNFSEGFLGAGGGDDGIENVVWVDGTPLAVGPVRFVFDPKMPEAPWGIRSADGGVELQFTPEGQRAQNVDLKVIVSRYVQPFGTFRGHVTAKDGARVPIEGLAGVTEDHGARW